MERTIAEGINGSGETIYQVQTTLDSGKVYIETFTTRNEAEHWVKWA